MTYSPFNFFKSRLAAKIWRNMVLPTVIILLLIIVGIRIYFNQYTLNNAIVRAREKTLYTASSLAEDYKSLMEYFVRKTTSAAFKNGFEQAISAAPDTYTEVNNSLQEVLAEYAQMNKLLASSLLITGPSSRQPGMIFHSYQYHLQDSTFSENDSVSGLTVLPYTQSPFLNQALVIPIAIPLKYISSTNMILIAEDIQEAQGLLYLFLNTETLYTYLNLYYNDTAAGSLYLVDWTGQSMSPSPAEDSPAVPAEVLAKSIAAGQHMIVYEDNYVFIEYINKPDLYLVNNIPLALFKNTSDNIVNALALFVGISILFITYLSVMINIYVTRPLNLLMESLHKIEMKTYSGKALITTNDEIGRLNEAIDSMFNTIQQQILIIKQEEKEAYESQLQLLSEQVNPHFLYNALEFINMEVYNHHIDNASNMISSLGEYLRISLAYGENELLISQEIDQVMAYVKIMNYRFRHSINIATSIPAPLPDTKILKCILQPLVENSLKHGFQISTNSCFPVFPMIDISMLVSGEQFILTITDNGAGIDIDKALQIMYHKQEKNTSDRHFGLNNIYQRLLTRYQEVAISFTSIPFYENKVIITLPARFFI